MVPYKDCNFTDNIVIRRHSYGLRIFSLFYAVCVQLFIFVCTFWFLFRRKKLVYLRKRNPGSVILISAGLLVCVHLGAMFRIYPETDAYITDCTLRNFLYVATVPILVLGQLNSLLYFKWRAAYSAAIAKKDENEGLHWWHKLLQKWWFQPLQTLTSSLSILIPLALISYKFCFECQQFDFSNVLFILACSLFVLPLFLQLLFTYSKLKDFPDPFRILQELYRGVIIGMGGSVIYVSLAIIVELLHVEKVPEREEIIFNGGIFVDIMMLSYYFYFVPYQIYLACKFNETEAIHTEITLERVLEQPVGHDLLKKYLITEFSVENILFLDALKAVEDKNTSSREGLRSIYRDFISTRILNISSSSYSRLEEEFRNSPTSIQVFSSAKKEILRLMEFDSFSRFKHSSYFRMYMCSDK